MTTIAQVRDSLAKAVATTGLRCDPYASDNYAAPCAQVVRNPMVPHMTLGAVSDTKHAYQFQVLVFVNRESEVAGQKLLDKWCDLSGDSSVVAAIENGNLWIATVDYARVTRIGQTLEYPRQPALLVVAFDVEVCW